MVSRQLGRLTAKVMRAAQPSAVRDRAVAFAALVRESYREGLQEPDRGHPGPAGDHAHASTDDETAASVAEALRSVDWATVRRATASRTTDVSRAMREMAAQVDWRKVQPVAASVSSALLAAVASGQIPLGGPIGGRVVRTILNDRDLAQRVAATLTPASMPPDFRPVIAGVIDTTARDGDAPAQNT